MKEFDCPICGTKVEFNIDEVKEGKKYKLCPNDDCIVELECIEEDDKLILIAEEF